jgi:DNA-binding transcriptional regulator LsrR (DeoR family)
MVVTDEGSIELERQGVVWGEIMYEIINREDIHDQEQNRFVPLPGGAEQGDEEEEEVREMNRQRVI